MARNGFNIAQMRKEFEQILGETKQDMLADLRVAVRATYLSVVGSPPAPVYTGFYASNHRILLRDRQGGTKGDDKAKLVPPFKPPGAKRGVYEGNISSTVAEELAKLRSIEIGDVITITTSVPYADDVERKHGNYSRAEALLGFRG